MNKYLLIICVFAISALLSKYGTEAWIRLAPRLGLVDHPNALRKLHTAPVPVGGGIVLFLTTVLVFAICHLSISPQFPYAKILFPFLVASTILVGVGLADDKWELSGKIKIFAQIVAVSLLLVFAGDYSTISFLGTEYNLGHLFYPIGILWFVGLINAVNFLDGADGVASTAGIIMSLAAAAIAMMTGQAAIAAIAFIFAGALLGFLFCNFPPAKVYLGDTGSMLIGLAIGVLLLRACTVDGRVILVAPPLAVAVIPVFDLVLSFFRRVSSGRGLFAPDRCHIQHRLLVRFRNGRKMLAVLAVLFALGGAAGCVGIYVGSDWPALEVVLLLPCGLMLTGLFGREEVRVLVRLVARRRRDSGNRMDQGKTLCYQGEGPWNELWSILLTSLRKHGCVRARLDIDVPSSHENYLARWNRASSGNCDAVVFLNIRLPLMEDNRKMGALNICFDPMSVSLETGMDVASQMRKLCMDYIVGYISSRPGSAFKPHGKIAALTGVRGGLPATGTEV